MSLEVSAMRWFRTPPCIYFNYASTMEALTDLVHAKVRRAFVLSNRNVKKCGHTKFVTDRLAKLDIEFELYADVENPTADTVMAIQQSMRVYQPDCVIGLGGGVVMDMAKLARFIYDPSKPVIKLEDLYAYDHRQLLTSQTEPVTKAIKKLVCIPTTSGTGSEMTPIAWVVQNFDDSKKLPLKRPVVSWAMTPDIAINDGYFTTSLPSEEAASGGLCALTIAIETLTSRLASDYTQALSIQAAKLIFLNLTSSIKGDQHSREACHRAASIAGLASANAFFGIAYGAGLVLSNFVESQLQKHLSQGVASGIVLVQIIRFNGSKSEQATRLYTMISNQTFSIGANVEPEEGGAHPKNGVERLATGLDDLRKQARVFFTLNDFISKKDLENCIDQLAEDCLKVVGCAATNPVTITIEDMKTILRSA